MKVYFTAARSFRKEFGKTYEKIVQILKNDGLDVFDDTKGVFGASLSTLTKEDKKRIYHEMISEMDKADFSVFEATWPSTIYVGYKIALSYMKNKPVIALYKGGVGQEPFFYKGMSNKKVVWIRYNDENLEKVLCEAVEKAKKMLDLRFNLFIPRGLMAYLDWVTKDVGVNKSEYIRMLIEKEVKKRK
jgi:hypothetical protein